MRYPMLRTLTFLAALLPCLALAQTAPSPTYNRLTLTGGLNLYASTLSSAPSSLGNWNNLATAFTGDLTRVFAPLNHQVTGASTLGQPSSGYTIYPEASARIMSVFNSSGWNQSLTSNGGRTGLFGEYSKMWQYGQGDLTAYGCFGLVASTRASATSYLANPEVACMAGDLYGLAPGAYLEGIGDLNFHDGNAGANDIAAAGIVMNFERSNATGALGTNWLGTFMQSIGSKPIDAAHRMAGPMVVGVDMSQANLAYYRLASVTVNTAGTGYTVGDILTVTGGTAVTPTLLQVATISGGAGTGPIASVTPINTGIYTVPPVTIYTTMSFTGGTGSGAALAGFYNTQSALILPTAGGCIQVAENTGSPITQLSGYNGALCVTGGGLSWGPANTMPTGRNSNNVALGSSNLLQGTNNTVLGNNVYDVAGIGGMYFSGGAFTGTGQGTSQTSWRIMRGSSTGSAQRLTTNQAAAGGQNSYTVRTSSAHAVGFRVLCVDAINTDAAMWKLRQGLLTRTSAGNAAYVGEASTATAPDYSTGAGSTASLIVAADTTNQALSITATPPAATGHTWRCEATVWADQAQ